MWPTYIYYTQDAPLFTFTKPPNIQLLAGVVSPVSTAVMQPIQMNVRSLVVAYVYCKYNCVRNYLQYIE